MSVDMPLKQLLHYQGTNPKPEDFNEYWIQALAELDRQTMTYTLEPVDAPFCGVELFELYFTGVGDAKIHARFLKPKTVVGKLPAVLLFHGYTGSCGYWFDKLPYAYNGIAVAAMDVRGQGGSSEDTLRTFGSTYRGHIVRGIDEESPHKLFYRNVYLDTVQLARILQSMEDIDESRIGTAGFSQGGALAAVCAGLVPKIKAACIGSPFLSDFQRVCELDMDKREEPYFEISQYFKKRDPLHEKASAFFKKLGYIDVQNFAEHIQCKVLFSTGLMDIHCPPSTHFAVYNKINAPKELKVYPDFPHEHLPDEGDARLKFFLENL